MPPRRHSRSRGSRHARHLDRAECCSCHHLSNQMIDPEKVYRQTTPSSRAMHERAVKVMPGGTTRTTTYFDPHPLYIERGEGCRIWDADGTERIDMLGNYSAMILGHAHPKVVEAINQQAARGTAFAAANPIEVELATILREEGSQVAAVILEPIIGAGGVIAATPEFIARLRAVTRELGMLLIFDEVISLRVAPGGAQQLYGVTPDLTTMGKIIGGGLPVAAFGGRA